jgi:hypothetical protein
MEFFYLKLINASRTIRTTRSPRAPAPLRVVALRVGHGALSNARSCR